MIGENHHLKRKVISWCKPMHVDHLQLKLYNTELQLGTSASGSPEMQKTKEEVEQLDKENRRRQILASTLPADTKNQLLKKSYSPWNHETRKQKSQHTLAIKLPERLAPDSSVHHPLLWPHITLGALQCWGRLFLTS